MSMEVKDIPSKVLLPYANKLKRYLPFLFILILLGLYAYLILQVNELTQAEADETEVLEQLHSTSRPQIDQQAIDRILELQDQNVQVEALFQEARDNPFSEAEFSEAER